VEREVRRGEPGPLTAIVEVLSKAGWNVSTQPDLGPIEPDLVIRSSKGRGYVMDINVIGIKNRGIKTRGPAHFGNLRELSYWKHMLERKDISRELGLGEETRVVLVTDQTVEPSFVRMANDLGVTVVPVEGDPRRIADTLLRSLTKLENEPPI
jgi:hypothetical protein